MKGSKSIYFNLYFSSNYKHNVAQDLTLVIGQVLSFKNFSNIFQNVTCFIASIVICKDLKYFTHFSLISGKNARLPMLLSLSPNLFPSPLIITNLVMVYLLIKKKAFDTLNHEI